MEALDATLKPHEGSARMGIDDGVMHAPPEILYPAMDNFFAEISKEAGLEANQDKTKVYSPIASRACSTRNGTCRRWKRRCARCACVTQFGVLRSRMKTDHASLD